MNRRAPRLAFAAALALIGLTRTAAADEEGPTPAPPPPDDGYTLRPSAMLGLSQWTLFGGGNVAAQLKVGRVAFEYSHGQALDFGRVGGFAQTADENDSGVTVRMPWTTGGGVGFQITPRLHVLLEVKAHRYEITGANANESIAYTSFTVGPGVFYDLYLYRGLFLQPSARWWPTVASTYDDKGTLTRTDGTRYQHERHDLLPFVNVSLGYTFTGI